MLFFVVIFSRHISNLNFRKDTFLNANSYSTLTSLNYPHSLQNGLTSKAVNRNQAIVTYKSQAPTPLSCVLSYLREFLEKNQS